MDEYIVCLWLFTGLAHGTNYTSGEIDPWRDDRTIAELDLQPPTSRIVSRDIFAQNAFPHENFLRSLNLE